MRWSRPAARVWMACDGNLDAEGLGVRLGISSESVIEILDLLSGAGMVTPPVERRLSRRAALAGGVGAGAAVVASIVLPTPAMASSGSGLGSPPTPANNQAVSLSPATGQAMESGTSGGRGAEAKSNGEGGMALAFTGTDLPEEIAIGAGAIATGAALVGTARRTTRPKEGEAQTPSS